MSKTLVIAVREYLAAVKTKGFLIGLIMMPLLMGGGVVLQSLTRTIEVPASGSIAVIDRTRDKKIWTALKEAADRLKELADRSKRPIATYDLESVDIPSDPSALDGVRLTLADRVRAGRLTTIVEAGPNALAKRDPPTTQTPSAAATPAGARRASAYPAVADDADDAIFFTTNRPALTELRSFVENGIRPVVIAERLEQSPDTVRSVLRSADGVLFSRGLAQRSASGALSFEPRSNEIATLMLPVGMVVVMLMVVLVGASPLTTNIIEEKQLRIAEVLVGSVTPFTLMLGKLLGGVATSLTLGVIYIGGAAAVASRMGMFEIVTPGLVMWFMVFTVIGSLMYGALFVVAGAAVTNVKEAQAIMTPLMLVVVLPMFLVGPLMNEPHGTVGLAGTFFPLTAPLVTMMRLTTPPPIAWWQPVGALLSSGLLTIALVWLAGRVFRAGFLLVGRPAKFGEMIGWILRG